MARELTLRWAVPIAIFFGAAFNTVPLPAGIFGKAPPLASGGGVLALAPAAFGGGVVRAPAFGGGGVARVPPCSGDLGCAPPVARLGGAALRAAGACW